MLYHTSDIGNALTYNTRLNQGYYDSISELINNETLSFDPFASTGCASSLKNPCFGITIYNSTFTRFNVF